MSKLDELLMLMKAEGIIKMREEERVTLNNQFEAILQKNIETLTKSNNPKIQKNLRGCAIVLSILEICRGVGVTRKGIHQRTNVVVALLNSKDE